MRKRRNHYTTGSKPKKLLHFSQHPSHSIMTVQNYTEKRGVVKQRSFRRWWRKLSDRSITRENDNDSDSDSAPRSHKVKIIGMEKLKGYSMSPSVRDYDDNSIDRGSYKNYR